MSYQRALRFAPSAARLCDNDPFAPGGDFQSAESAQPGLLDRAEGLPRGKLEFSGPRSSQFRTSPTCLGQIFLDNTTVTERQTVIGAYIVEAVGVVTFLVCWMTRCGSGYFNRSRRSSPPKRQHPPRSLRAGFLFARATIRTKLTNRPRDRKLDPGFASRPVTSSQI